MCILTDKHTYTYNPKIIYSEKALPFPFMTDFYLVPASVCAPERVGSWPVDHMCWKWSRSPPAPGLLGWLNLWGGTTARRSSDSVVTHYTES